MPYNLFYSNSRCLASYKLDKCINPIKSICVKYNLDKSIGKYNNC